MGQRRTIGPGTRVQHREHRRRAAVLHRPRDRRVPSRTTATEEDAGDTPPNLRAVAAADAASAGASSTLAASPEPEGARPEVPVVPMEPAPGAEPDCMGIQRARPSHEILSGDSADVYFARAESILDAEGLDPLVTMEVFTRREAVLCGIDEAKNLLGHVLASADPSETRIEALDDGDRIEPKEIVLRIRARYRRFGLYETAFLGMLAQSTGWATAARDVVDAAAPDPVISFGARHIHP